MAALMVERIGPPVPEDTHTLFGRTFAVLARFSGAGYVDRANAYMLENHGACLLEEVDGTAILAHRDDKGRKRPA